MAAREADAAELAVADVAGADNSEFDNLIDWHSPECGYIVCAILSRRRTVDATKCRSIKRYP